MKYNPNIAVMLHLKMLETKTNTDKMTEDYDKIIKRQKTMKKKVLTKL